MSRLSGGQSCDLESVKKTLRALLISSKHGLTERQLLRDYTNVTGERLDYHVFGFRTLREFLNSLPDVVRMVPERNGPGMILFGESGGNEDVERVASLVARQKTTKPYLHVKAPAPAQYSPPTIPPPAKMKLRTLMLSYPNGMSLDQFPDAFARRFGYYINVNHWGFQDLHSALDSIPDVLVVEFSEQLHRYRIRGAQQPPRIYSGNQSSMNSLEGSPAKNPSTSRGLSSEEAARTPAVTQEVSGKLSRQIKQLLQAHPEGVWVSRFLTEFKSHHKEDLSLDKLGYTGVVHLLSSLPNICDLERPQSTGDWIIYAHGEKGLSESPPQGRRPHSTVHLSEDLLHKPNLPPARLPEETAEMIRKVLCRYPAGMPLYRFTHVYKETTFSELSPAQYGFQNVRDLLKEVGGVAVVMGGNNYPIVKLLMKEEGEEMEEEERIAATRDRAPTVTAGQPTARPARPPSSTYSKQPIPHRSAGVGVYVSFIKSPSCLSLQLIGEETSKALDSLMEDTMEFYNSKAGEKYVFTADPILGEPCCAPFNNDGYWYRGEVVALPQPDTVEVFYVDYGNKAVIPRASLRRPKPHYLALPAQAIQCRLANIQPAGGSWSLRAATLLYQMTLDKPIVAIVTSIKSHCLSVCLCDTTSKRDIHINDTLVAQGLAVFEPDTRDDEVGYDAYQLEPPPSETSVDACQVRMPITTGSAASMSVGTEQVAATHYQQNLIQLLLAQQNALLLNQQSRMMASGTALGPSQHSESHSSSSVVPPPPGFSPSLLQRRRQQLPSSQLAPSGAAPPPPQSPPASKQPPPLPSPSPPPPSPPSPSPPSPSPPSQLPLSPSPPPPPPSPSPPPPPPSPPSTEAVSRSESETTDRERKRSLIKRMQLTPDHHLHLFFHNEQPFSLSSEVAKWFWGHDQLQGMLRKAQQSIWGLCLMRQSSPLLFEAMAASDDVLLQKTGENSNSITFYALEDIPRIVSTFKGSQELHQAVLKAVAEWKENGVEIFPYEGDSGEEYSLMEKLKRLQLMRTIILRKMVAESSGHEEPLGGSVEKFMVVEKEIEHVSKQLEMLKNKQHLKRTEKKKETRVRGPPSTFPDELIFSDMSQDSASTLQPSSPPPPLVDSTPPPPLVSSPPTAPGSPPPPVSTAPPPPHLPPHAPPLHAPLHPPPPHAPLHPPPPLPGAPPPVTISELVLSQPPMSHDGLLPYPHQPHFSSSYPMLSQPRAPSLLGCIYPSPPIPFPRPPPLISPHMVTASCPLPPPPPPQLFSLPAFTVQPFSQWGPPPTKPLPPSSTKRQHPQPPISSSAVISSSSSSCVTPQLRKSPPNISPPAQIKSSESCNTGSEISVSSSQPAEESSNRVQSCPGSSGSAASSSSWNTGPQHKSSAPSSSSSSHLKESLPQETPPALTNSPPPPPPPPAEDVSTPRGLYSVAVCGSFSPQKAVGLGRGKQLSSIPPPSSSAGVGRGRGQQLSSGWHTVLKKKTPVTVPEGFPPIGSGAGLDII